MKRVGNTRLASIAAGDDTSLTRMIKIEGHKKSRKLQPRFPGVGTAAFVDQGRTKFTASVKRVEQMTNILVSGHSNVKIGRDVRKGRLKGYWIYTVSLEERKTCPTSCAMWQNCYGNNMPFAKRVDHTDPEFLPRLEKELSKLCATKYGVLIRLHALGDFYSRAYVWFWRRMLQEHPNLSIFGYTARNDMDGIGSAVRELHAEFGMRAALRHSNGSGFSTIVIGQEDGRPADSFICPEQTGKTRCCATCGACWSTPKRVAFLEH